MTGNLFLRDRTPVRAVDLRLLKRLLRVLIEEWVGREINELGIYLVGTGEITRINEAFLRHQGPTDVITFDYADSGRDPALSGEIFVCLPEAKRQARRFRVAWQQEVVRYLVHGVLHLCGYDDRRAADRLRMKREEGRLLRALEKRFTFRQLALSRRARTARAGRRLKPRSSVGGGAE